MRKVTMTEAEFREKIAQAKQQYIACEVVTKPPNETAEDFMLRLPRPFPHKASAVGNVYILEQYRDLSVRVVSLSRESRGDFFV